MDPLLALPLDAPTARARLVRAGATGTRITFSPKVFIPLTRLCRDRCGYCTFATAPAQVPAAYPAPDEVLSIARRSAEAVCHEPLLTLGEQPEDRYPAVATWLGEHGGTLLDESISRAAGALHGQELVEADFRAIVEPTGRRVRERTTLYGGIAA